MINSKTASNYSITPELSYYGTKTRVKFSGSCLKQHKATYNHGIIANKYNVHEISKNYNISSYPTYGTGYGIGFDRKGEFSFGTNGFGRNLIIFGADVSSSVQQITKKFMEKNCIQLILLKII